jgi:hypothetical protein
VRELLKYAVMRLATAFIVVLLAACGTEEGSSSTSLTREPGECSDVEVHVIGVSDGGDDGSSTVVLQRPGHHILVLSGYKSIDWDVQVSNGAVLDGIYATGYEPQHVRANVRTQINTESVMAGGAGAWGYKYPATDTTALLKLASIRVARHATSFHGCFASSKWVIGENMAVTSDCGTATSSYETYHAVIDCDGDNTCGQDGDGDGDEGDGAGDGSLY